MKQKKILSYNFKIMNLVIKKNIYIVNIFILFLIFVFPNGGSAKFNGLPWNNGYETLILILYFPLVFFLLKKFFQSKFTSILIIILLFFKLALLFFPNIGIGHNIYIDDEKLKTKTYNNFWQKKYSSIQQYEWNEKDNFPLNSINFNDKYNNVLGSNAKSNESFNDLILKTEFDFYLNYNQINNFVILFEGDYNKSKIEFRPLNEMRYQNLEYDKLNKLYYIKKESKIDENLFHFKGKLYFSDSIWKFTPYILKENKKFSAFNEGVIFTDINDKNSYFLNFSNLFLLYEYLIFLIIFSSFLFLIYDIFKNNPFKNELIFSIIFCFSTTIFDLLLRKVGFYHPFWPLCLALLFFIFILLLDNLLSNKLFKGISKKPNQYLIILIFPTFAIIGFQYFNTDFLKTSYWAHGNDWSAFANYSKQIVIDNQWILAGEETFYFRPGIRYFYAFFHILFGESAFALKYVEYLLIFFISIFTLNIMLKMKTNLYLSIIFSLILLVFFIGESFRWLIGRGLSEYYGTFIIMAMCYFFIDEKINYLKLFILGLLGIISCWLREEKLLLVLPLILFTASGQITKNSFFNFIFNFLVNNYKKILFYWFVVILGFPILFEFRNYYISNNFTIINHPNFYLNENSFKFHILPFYEMILATPYNNMPRLIPLITIPTFIISILIILFPKLFRKFPFPALSIIILSIILPTFIFHLAAYVPRHSIYLLPFSIILFTKIFENLIKSFVYKNFT